MQSADRALLFVMMDMPAEHDAELNRWYAEEHLPERAACPGFLNARRFRAVMGVPPYLATYDLTGLGALETPEYRRLAEQPSEWTRRIGELLTASVRNVYVDRTPDHVRGDGPHPDTKALLAVMIGVAPEHDADVEDWYDKEHLAERLACPGFLSARRFTAVQGSPRHLALYELTGLDALETPEYLRVAVQPTVRTSQILRWREQSKRNVYERIA